MKAYLKPKHELKKESLKISLRITQKINELFNEYNLSLREHFPQVNDHVMVAFKSSGYCLLPVNSKLCITNKIYSRCELWKYSGIW